MTFEAWHCTRHDGKLCPAEGCPASYGCAIDRGWSQGQPSPPQCQDITRPSAWWSFYRILPGLLVEASRASAFRRGWSFADLHPVAWFVIVTVVSFTVGALVF